MPAPVDLETLSEPSRAAPLRIGITCFPSTGGSGVVATEIGLGLARRGHQVHFICYDVPGRLRPALDQAMAGVCFHRVSVPDYPLQHLGPYPLTLAAQLAEVSAAVGLDLVHVHYAVPHAASAYLARELLQSRGARVPRVVATLHGTDVTRVGSDPCLLPINQFSLARCDGLTTPSAFLRAAAYELLGLPAQTAIDVIPNFVDTDHFHPAATPATSGPPLLVHSSNFRPLKRIDDVVRILAGVRRVLPAELLLVGDGPERPRIEALVRELNLDGAVHFLGMQLDVRAALQRSAVFLLPSSSEGFGLAALEALSCGVPVVASRVGGVPEVVSDGETGQLCAVGDIAGMTAAVLRLLQEPALHRQMAQAARRSVEQRWQAEPTVARYEAFYQRVLAG